MTDNLPDYDAVEPPSEKPKAEYSTHERRAAVWGAIRSAGSPARVNKAALSRNYDVTRETIYRDFERLREWAGDELGADAKLTSRAVFEKAIGELLAADDWKATKAAWDIVMDWNDWLAEIGEQHREPDRVEADIRTRNQSVEYQVVRDDEPDLPTDDDSDGVDHEALGFADGPTGVGVEPVDDLGGDA